MKESMNATETKGLLIFQEPSGLWHISSDALSFRDATGCGYSTRAEATREACYKVLYGFDFDYIKGKCVVRKIAKELGVEVRA